MLNKKQIKDFKEKGYIIINFIDKKNLTLVKKNLADMIMESARHNLPKYYKKNIKKMKNTNFILNDVMSKLESVRHEHLSKIYDIIAKSSSFLNLLCEKKILLVINKLMRKKPNHNLYLNCNAIRMDVFRGEKFMYGWHRDNNTNIPHSNFIQLWMPLNAFLGKGLGGIKVLEGSHKKNLITSETKNEMKRLIGNRPMRTSLKAKVYGHEKYREKLIELYPGQALVFHNSLMHKGEKNIFKKKVRYVCGCFYHDTNLLEKKFINRDFKDKKIKPIYSS